MVTNFYPGETLTFGGQPFVVTAYEAYPGEYVLAITVSDLFGNQVSEYAAVTVMELARKTGAGRCARRQTCDRGRYGSQNSGKSGTIYTGPGVTVDGLIVTTNAPKAARLFGQTIAALLAER